jgi:hypothetical protein
VVRHPATVAVAFGIAHVWLAWLSFAAPNQPLGDVTLVYRFWVGEGLTNGGWVGIDQPGVYPVLALVPMLAAWAFGPDAYPYTWLAIVTVLDAAALAVVLALGRARGVVAGWWWTVFLVALGPIALGRIDTVTVPFALVGLVLLARRPAVAAVLLTVAAWIKVWPAALVAAAVVVSRSRLVVAVAALATTAVVVVGGLLLGADRNLVSFLGQQAERGLQIESVLATPWMWHAVAGGTTISYDVPILTFQVHGPGVDVAASLATGLVAVAALAILALGIVAVRRGRGAARVLPPLALALTVALILFNKVGSPQFVTWLAVPLVVGLLGVATDRAFRAPALLTLVLAALTQAVYPFLYAELTRADPGVVALLTARNLLYVALFAWSVAALIRIVRQPADSEEKR